MNILLRKALMKCASNAVIVVCSFYDYVKDGCLCSLGKKYRHFQVELFSKSLLDRV